MSLPFLPKRQVRSAGIAVKVREPDEKPEESQDQDDPSAAIRACAKALIDAVHARDEQGVADAMVDAFDILESMPHDEVDHSQEDQEEEAP